MSSGRMVGARLSWGRRLTRRSRRTKAVGRPAASLSPSSLNASIVGQTRVSSPVGSVVDVSLPGSEWQRVEAPDATTFVRAGDLAECGGAVEWAAFRFWIQTLDALQLSAGDAIQDAMRRRVRQGSPDHCAAKVAGVEALRFDWTDGVAEVRSYFVHHSSGSVIEFGLATMRFPSGALMVPLDEAAERLLSRIKWI